MADDHMVVHLEKEIGRGGYGWQKISKWGKRGGGVNGWGLEAQGKTCSGRRGEKTGNGDSTHEAQQKEQCKATQAQKKGKTHPDTKINSTNKTMEYNTKGKKM